LGTFALLATGAENMLLLCYRKRSKTTLFFAAALQIILILFGILGSFNSAMILLGRLTIAALSLLIFVGCATTPIYDETRLTLEVVKRPFNEWPEVYKQLEK
jgi:hypothetical protein